MLQDVQNHGVHLPHQTSAMLPRMGDSPAPHASHILGMHVRALCIGLCLSAATLLGSTPVIQAQSAENHVVIPYPTTDELQTQVNAFVRALIQRDMSMLRPLLSSEVIARTRQRGMGLSAFLEKQRTALLRTFDLSYDEPPELEVAEAIPDGDVVRVQLHVHGEMLSKPFYFVREGDTFKINVAPPGFSQAAPEGALFGSSNYTVHNVNIPGNAPFTLSCYQGKNSPDKIITVPASSTRKVSCQDACGFWSGSLFAGPQRVRACDWNAWGDDVRINLLSPDGWDCVDYC